MASNPHRFAPTPLAGTKGIRGLTYPWCPKPNDATGCHSAPSCDQVGYDLSAALNEEWTVPGVRLEVPEDHCGEGAG